MARPVGRRITNEIVYAAVVAAGRAPSVHHAQPWRWRVSNGVLDLFADSAGRLATIGCGAALNHARLAVAARGWRVTVTRRPDAAEPAHLARLHIDGPAPVSAETAGLARAIRMRHPGPVTAGPVEPGPLRTIGAAVTNQHVSFEVLRPDQVPGLSEADGSATFAVLHGPDDQDLDWLRAGEALSLSSLVAAGLGVSVVPIDDSTLRKTPDLGYPYLILRLNRHQIIAH